MQFAIAMSLVMFISTALLLYQFWTGSLAENAADTAAEPEAARRPDLRQAA